MSFRIVSKIYGIFNHFLDLQLDYSCNGMITKLETPISCVERINNIFRLLSNEISEIVKLKHV